MYICTLIQIGMIVIAVLLVSCVVLSLMILKRRHKLKSKIKQESKEKIAW